MIPDIDQESRWRTPYPSGQAIMLLDGAYWVLAEPVATVGVFVGGGSVVPYPRMHLDQVAYMPSFDKMVESAIVRMQTEDVGDSYVMFSVLAPIVMARLLATYHLSFEEIEGLCDPGPEPWTDEERRVVTKIIEAANDTFLQFRAVADRVTGSLTSEAIGSN
jgi:hypothetical protein